jgi:hypothetical protein
MVSGMGAGGCNKMGYPRGSHTVRSDPIWMGDTEDSKISFNFVFALIVFMWFRSPFLYLFSSAAPQRTAYSEVPFQMVSPS